MPAKCSAQHTDASTGEIARQGFPFNLYIWQTLGRVGLRSLMQLFFWACWAWLIIFSLSLKVHEFKELLFFRLYWKGPFFSSLFWFYGLQLFCSFAIVPHFTHPQMMTRWAFMRCYTIYKSSFWRGGGVWSFFVLLFYTRHRPRLTWLMMS